MSEELEPAAALYRGEVMHARLRPVPHRFAYRVFSLLVDIDRLADADRMTPLFSVGRFNLLSFHPDDHGALGRIALRDHVEALLRAKGADVAGGRIRLLCYPRVLGVGFNPLSIYFAEDAAGRLAGIVHEVRNTFGERHAYAIAIRPGELDETGLRHQAEKAFHVSPFVPAEGTYRFRIAGPDRRVRVHILERDRDGPLLVAAFRGERCALDTRGILAACLRAPFMTLKVIAAIRFEALRLWAKGVKIHRRPSRACARLP
ncbi:DUF1365 domain-containing protein [Salinarimonas soli]|nr:DUF1365 domain-containing protein [Salinarimonas soli]